jgi:hypothetical protein
MSDDDAPVTFTMIQPIEPELIPLLNTCITTDDVFELDRRYVNTFDGDAADGEFERSMAYLAGAEE